ncbi:MAG: TolC family protein [Bacteroidota bacterium]
MKKIHLLVLLFSPLLLIGQTQKISLKEAIKSAQERSPDYKANLHRNEASYWRNRNYRASFLPQFRLNATLPAYSNSIQRITNDEGQDIFVDQNQARIDARLFISQNIGFTGGNLSINSQIERVNIFGEYPSKGYSIVPFSINYFQNSLTYNPYKWDRKIEPLVFEESKRDFIESMEQISLKTCLLYFSLLKSQIQLEISKNNSSNLDTLFQITKGRYRMGKIAENDLLQMELRLLNSKNEITTNTILLKKASQDLSRYLELTNEDFELEIPETLIQFEVSTEKAILEAKSNRKFVIEYRRRRLESEKELARVKGENGLKINLNANFGISQHGPELNDLFQNFDQQQNLTLTLGVPIFDWGVSKSKRRLAKANLDLLITNLDQENQAFEQEIYLHTLNWANQRSFLATTEKAQIIASKRYEIAKKRYVLGKISITDLNLAQEEKDKSVVNYLNSLGNFWVDYYTLRRLTLYDFVNDKKIEAQDIIYE